MLPSVANTFRGRANALFIRFLSLPVQYTYPPLRKPLGMRKPHFQGLPLCFKLHFGAILGVAKCCQALINQKYNPKCQFHYRHHQDLPRIHHSQNPALTVRNNLQ